MENQIQIFQGIDHKIKVEVRFEEETVWLTQGQLIELFDSSKANISEHIKSIFQSNELEESATVRKFRTVQKEGKRNIERSRLHYNLDVIISVGYRVNSKRGTQFRQWATCKFSKISVVSTNKVAQKVIESYLDSMPNPFEFNDSKVGNFALPIVQIVLTETSEEEAMSWKNNNTWALARFAKQLQLPQQTILLNPIYTAGDVSIHH